jgi:glycosyltransferase involved in cell wall biosynthesis
VCPLTGAGELSESIERWGGTVRPLGKRRGADPAALIRLAAIIRKGRFSLLHLHNLPGNLWGTPAAVLSRTGMPVVRTEHGYLFHRRYPAIYKYLYPLLSKRSERIICVCEDLRQTLAGEFPSLAGRFVTLRNGIPAGDFDELPEREECRRGFGLPENQPIAGTVGRLSEEKNHLELLRAFRIAAEGMGDPYLAILGEGEMEHRLRAEAENLGIAGRVIFLGSTGDIERFYGALDLFVLSSASEGIPLTLLEAMASGLPALAPPVGGIPEVMEDGLSGYFYTPGSCEAMAERMIELLSDRGMGRRMGMRGRTIVKEDFNAERFASGQDDIYREVIPGN